MIRVKFRQLLDAAAGERWRCVGVLIAGMMAVESLPGTASEAGPGAREQETP